MRAISSPTTDPMATDNTLTNTLVSGDFLYETRKPAYISILILTYNHLTMQI